MLGLREHNKNILFQDRINTVKEWFNDYYRNETELRHCNCVYLTMSIYYNLYSHDKNWKNNPNLLKNCDVGIVFKIDSTDVEPKSVYSRLKDEMNKSSCIFTVPILVMKGIGSRNMEHDIFHSPIIKHKLILHMVNKMSLRKP